jgi:hypothetical protein
LQPSTSGPAAVASGTNWLHATGAVFAIPGRNAAILNDVAATGLTLVRDYINLLTAGRPIDDPDSWIATANRNCADKSRNMSAAAGEERRPLRRSGWHYTGVLKPKFLI